MSDIIANARQLLDGATPAPWEVHTYEIGGAIYGIGNIEPGYGGGDPLDCVDKDAYLAAAAPELAQALAEETYEYSIQIKNHTGEWETATNSETHLEEWWESKKHAEWAMAEEREYGEHCRIVRRRVSPPEVIND